MKFGVSFKEEDQRKFKRIFFSEKDNVRAVFSNLGHHFLLDMTVLNLSESGIGLMMWKRESNGIHSGDILMLKAITGHPRLDFIRNIQSEIRWILNHKFLDHVGIGCEFVNMPLPLKDQLRNSLSNDI